MPMGHCKLPLIDNNVLKRKLAFTYSEANFVKLGYELTNTGKEDMVHFHIALQPLNPNSTFIRNCVTLRPPPSTASGADEQKVADFFVQMTQPKK